MAWSGTRRSQAWAPAPSKSDTHRTRILIRFISGSFRETLLSDRAPTVAELAASVDSRDKISIWTTNGILRICGETAPQTALRQTPAVTIASEGRRLHPAKRARRARDPSAFEEVVGK